MSNKNRFPTKLELKEFKQKKPGLNARVHRFCKGGLISDKSEFSCSMFDVIASDKPAKLKKIGQEIPKS